ncbi:hypothetical protein AFM12_03930 [Jiulongibacter sediminis]|uniref:NHL repeat containing protein n=2 Tax=Jiulongibacter sediminis TaxID=1605367 RepID=A0A0N8HAH0_9BACT|nr:hypothetical protein AFM12_03930 [Jiulongibacter sediminis]TBX27164.1 hypothetical protein TK44_03935 [Jiulongibacter sediminis]
MPEVPPTFYKSLAGADPLVSQYQIFKGSKHSPFLAPRGVLLDKNLLAVSDTGQNRVFIWKKVPKEEFAEPDIVLGQTNSDSTGRNSGLSVTACTLHYPSGIWSDGEKLIVADAWNHRVLIWHRFPEINGQPADVVLGQPGFETNEPNVHGIGSLPSSQSLNWPYGVFVKDNQLFIADTGNRRILYFKSIPENNYAKADGVIGKKDFETRDYENNEPIWPYSLHINDQGNLSVADTQFYRNLIWKKWEDAFEKEADLIIGQNGFNDAGQNQFHLFPKENTMNWTYTSHFYKNGIFIADTGNSRLLWFSKLPDRNNSPADNLIGHDNFNTGSENQNTKYGTESQLYWPFSISSYKNKLAIADTGNHRVVLTELTI